VVLARIVGLSLLLALRAAPAVAFEQAAFETERFKADLIAGRAIVVHISAAWCPTCWTQHLVLSSLANAPEYASVRVYEVDFDQRKDVARAFRAQHQSTLIAFHGQRELARSVGDTSMQGIREVLASSLK
jgi:thioredoxin-like negative regulator of GroEL